MQFLLGKIDIVDFPAGSSEQLLSPDCWRTSLRVLGCSPHPKMKTNQPRSILLSPQQVTQNTLILNYFFDIYKHIFTGILCFISKYLTQIEHYNNIMFFQVDETIEWLSKFFLKLRLSNADFRSFGLLSKWGPYIEEVKVFCEDLITYVIYLELNNCSKEPVGSPRLVKGTNLYFFVML